MVQTLEQAARMGMNEKELSKLSCGGNWRRVAAKLVLIGNCP